MHRLKQVKMISQLRKRLSDSRQKPKMSKHFAIGLVVHVLLLKPLKATCEKKGHQPTEAFIIIIFQVCKLVNEDYKRTPYFPLTITLGFCKPLIYGEQNDVGL